MATAIETDDLTRAFGARTAVDGLRLRVPAGKVFGFLGPNGAGKTTTIHLLLGILPPTRGSATVAGADVATQGDEVRRRCGALLEHHGLYERLSARQNLEFHARLHHLAPDERRTRVRDALERLGWWERRDERVATWSKGMKQRLAIARAQLHQPQVLFLDEPTNGFDPAAAAGFRDDLRGLVREGTTVFLTTHNLHEAEQVCDNVAVVRDGQLVASGKPDALGRPQAQDLVVVCAGWTPRLLSSLRRRKEVAGVVPEEGQLVVRLRPGAAAAPILRALVTGGVTVEEARRSKVSLEQQFLAILRGEP